VTPLRVIVVGAGIVGTACADELVQRGVRVTVLERGCLAGGATGAGMGHLVVEAGSDAQLALTRLSLQLWDELVPALPPAAEYVRSGTLWTAEDDHEMAEAERKAALLHAAGVRADLLDGRALAEIEPELRSGLRGGLLIPDDGIVYAPRVAGLLLDRAMAGGATFRRPANVIGVGGGRVHLDDGTTLDADAVVLATGQWARELGDVPVRPRKGHVAITDRVPPLLRHHVVELGYIKKAHDVNVDSVAFAAHQRPTGQVFIGSSRQLDPGHDPSIDRRTLAAVLARAVHLVPRLAGLDVLRAWTGHRAAPPDGRPVIGPRPDDDTVWLATGHEGLGITSSLGTARLVAAGLTGETPPIDPSPYHPQRFQVGAVP
jgi:glycine/D-amino acid oxidase-like deaminating enzyme